jgi:peptide/nickel transport system substrate-binding protein
MIRRPLLVLAATAATLSLAATAAGGGTAKSILVFGIGADVTGFNTALACCSSFSAAEMGTTESTRGAFVQNQKGVWVKDIVTQASATKTTLSYTIRPNAYWYWGGRRLPVTYQDFVYTLQKLDDPSTLVASNAGYTNLDPTRFTHNGPRQVTFYWRNGAYANWQSLFSSIYPSQALAGEDFNTIWTTCICGNDGQPVSDGPFYLASYTKGQGAVLKANPYFYGRKPGLAEIDMKILPSADSEVQALRGGELDAIAPPFGDNLSQLRGQPGITFSQVPGYVFEHIEFRLGKGESNPLLRAPWLRRAIALAIDRKSIIQTVYGQLAGNERPMNNAIYYTAQPQYRPDFARWNFSPAKAVALLERHCTGGPSAPSVTNTAVWQCAGLPARFRYTTTAGVFPRITTEAIVKAELMAVGIDLIDDSRPSTLLFSPAGIPSGDFDIVELADITSGDPGDWYDVWRCGGAVNYTGYCSAKVSALLRRGNTELDPAKRAADFQAADKLLAADVPVIPLYQKPAVLIHKDDVLGMVANPGANGPVWNIEDWRWKK